MRTTIILLLVLLNLSAFSQGEDIQQTTNIKEVIEQRMVIYSKNKSLSSSDQDPMKYKHFKRWMNRWLPRLDENGSPETYFQKEKEYFDRQQQGLSSATAGTWRELGPIGKPALGSDIHSGNGWMERGVGPVEFIQFYPTNTLYKLCGSLNGGLFYRTPNNPSVWKAATLKGWYTVNGCSWADYDHSNPNRVFAASSRGSQMGQSFGGNSPFAQLDAIGYTGGIFRNNNLPAENDWEQIGNSDDFGIWASINKLIVDPTDANIIYAATSKGLFKTTNAKASNVYSITWTKKLEGNIYDIELLHHASTTIYAVAIDQGATWLKYSTNSGNTFYTVPGQPSTSGAMSATIETTEAFSYYIYYALRESVTEGELYRFNTHTNSWSHRGALGDLRYGGGHGFGVSNSNPEQVFVSDYDRYNTSSNGGVNWIKYDRNHTNVLQYHVDVEDFAAEPQSSTIWMADHGGVHKSTDNGVSWSNESAGLAIAEVHGMAGTHYDYPDRLIAGLYHDASVHSVGSFVNGNWNPQWATLYTGDGKQPLIDYQNPNIVYASAQMGNTARFENKGGGVFEKKVDRSYSGDFHTRIAMNTADPTVIYTKTIVSGGREQINRVTNRLDWSGTSEQISNFTDNGCVVWNLYTSPTNSNYLYAHVVHGNPGSRLFVSKNIETYHPYHVFWEEIVLPETTNRWISDLEVDYNDPDKFWITFGEQKDGGKFVYRYDGSQWHDITNNLNFSAYAAQGINQERSAAGGIYVSTDVGVFYADDNSLQNPWHAWEEHGSGLPNLPGFMEMNYKHNKIRVGTEGRGMWEFDFKNPSIARLKTGVRDENAYPNKLFVVPNPASKGEATITWPMKYATGTLHIYNSAGQLIATAAVNGNSYTINLETYTTGLYMVSYISGDGNRAFTEKLVVE